MRPMIFDPSDPDTMRDPYGAFAELRAACPVYHGDRAWYLSRYEDVRDSARDPNLGRYHKRGASAMFTWFEEKGMEASTRQLKDGLMLVDGAVHRTVRRLVNPHFTPDGVSWLAPAVRSYLESEVARLSRLRRFDIVAELFTVLPSEVVGMHIGVPQADRDMLRTTIEAGSRLTDAFVPAEVRVQMEIAYATLHRYFADLLGNAKDVDSTPLTATIAGGVGDGTISFRQGIALLTSIYLAGSETTGQTLGNGLFALLSDREQWQKLCDDAGLAAACFEESLRFDSPSQTFFRSALDDFALHDETIHAGDFVISLPGAANRDPEAFPDPDRFRAERFTDTDVPRVMSFGGGPHSCLGANLARLEGKIAFTVLSQSLPGLRLGASAPKRLEKFNTRGLAELWVEVGK